MKRLLLFVCLGLVVVLPGVAGGFPVRTRNGRLLSCPDPSVVRAHVGRYRYYLVCTSDYDANAYPIRGSDDLRHWRLISYVFLAGRDPWWAVPAPSGRYWAPAIYRIGGRWVVYFAAQLNGYAAGVFRGSRPRPPAGEFAVGVASARSLRGPWQSRLLHFRGEDNRFGREHETYGGSIDPSTAQDPRSGQRYLFWADQHTSIWAGELSRDGLRLRRRIHQVIWAHRGWECRTPLGRCTVEGPEETYRRGWFYMFFSGASTWTGTYAVGAAATQDPMRGHFVPVGSHPVLRSSRRWIGPGGTSAPVVGPGGREYILYHAMPSPDNQHVSAYRYLFAGRLTWHGVGSWYPLINNGRAG